MQTDLIQKALAGRKNALMSLQDSRNRSRDLGNVHRFPELNSNDVAALFDTTQLQFRHILRHSELQTA